CLAPSSCTDCSFSVYSLDNRATCCAEDTNCCSLASGIFAVAAGAGGATPWVGLAPEEAGGAAPCAGLAAGADPDWVMLDVVPSCATACVSAPVITRVAAEHTAAIFRCMDFSIKELLQKAM